jgi:uncharacterized RmlC-like cupin family protein
MEDKMAELKYSKYRLNNLAPEQRYRSFGRLLHTIVFTDDTIIKGSNHIWAFWITSPDVPPHGPHTHEADELLVMLGTDTNNQFELGAEVEICMGPEMEKHVVRESTLIYVPAGLPHGPIKLRNLQQPFIFIQAQRALRLTEEPMKSMVPPAEQDKMVFFDFDGTQTDEYVQKQYQQVQELTDKLKGTKEDAGTHGSEPATAGAETKYGKYFLNEIDPAQRKRKFGNMPSTIVYTDDDIIKGSHLLWALWRREPPSKKYGHGAHSHNDPETILTLGCDPDNPDDLGVESEDYMGMDMERYENDKTGLVFMPAGFVHGPAVDTAYTKPWIFVQCHYAPKLTEKAYKKLGTKEDDDEKIFFDLTGTETDEELAKQRAGRPGAPPVK